MVTFNDIEKVFTVIVKKVAHRVAVSKIALKGISAVYADSLGEEAEISSAVRIMLKGEARDVLSRAAAVALKGHEG